MKSRFSRGDMHLQALRSAFVLLVRLREKHERRAQGYDPFNERSSEPGALGSISSPVMETFLTICAAESIVFVDVPTAFRTWNATRRIGA